MSTQAYGKYYFGDNGFPITVKIVDASPLTQHEHDLTEVEHMHNFSELVIITGGHGIQKIEAAEYPVSAGDTFLIQGNKKHYFTSRNSLTLCNVMYDSQQLTLPVTLLDKISGYNTMFILEPSVINETFNSRLHLNRSDLSCCLEIVKVMNRECQSKEPGYEVSLMARLLELMVFLSRKYSTTQNNSGQALLKLSKVFNQLESKFAHHWDLASIANQVGMSKSNLLLTFKKATGQSPIDYLIQLRIQKSMELLRNSAAPVSDIAFAVGFNDSNYFSRQFNKINGSSPRNYRNSTKK